MLAENIFVLAKTEPADLIKTVLVKGASIEFFIDCSSPNAVGQ